MNKKKIITVFLLMILVSSNSVAFSLDKTNTKSVPEKQHSKQLKASVSDYRIDYVNADWWDKFHDPVLKGYVIKAMNNNQDLKIATLRVSQYQALVRESFGRELFGLDLGANLSRQKTSDTVSFGSLAIPTYRQSALLIPLTASYEIDLWGKNRERTLSAAKELEAVKYDEKAAYISLSSAVATAYFNVVKIDKLIELQKNIIAIRKEVLDLTRIKNRNGLCPTTDVIDTDKALTEAQSGLKDLQKYNSIFLNQLSVLIGESVEESSKLERTSLDDLNLREDLPQNIKSDLVLKRPDVLRAEAQLKKAGIDVKLARKDFLPNINISGQLGFNSNDLSRTFNSDSYILGGGIGLAQSLFLGGQRKARLKVRKIQYEQMLQNYQKTLLTSFQEVNDSLSTLKYDGEKNQDYISRLKAEENNLDLMSYKNKVGALAYLDLLYYKERVLVLQQQQMQSKADCLVNSLSLYKAVGGKL